MNKFISLLVSVFALTCVTLVGAQQSEVQASVPDQQSDFLQAYGSHPPEVTQPTENKDGSQDQLPSLSSEQPAVTATPDQPATPTQPKSIWERLKVPPQNVKPNIQQPETNDQSQTPDNPNKEQTQNNPSHYNIFQ